MESNLTAHIASRYTGNIAHSGSVRVMNAETEVTALNDLLIRVKFTFKDHEIMFRAMLSKHKEGLLMLIQDRVTRSYILSGKSGFLYEKPNVHGGLVSKINSFYFHIGLDYFEGTGLEIYFIGRKEEDYMRSRKMKSDRIRAFH